MCGGGWCTDDVAEERGRGVHVIDDDVDLAVIEEVAVGHAARDGDLRKASAFDGGNERELAVLVVEEQRTLRPGGAPVLADRPAG